MGEGSTILPEILRVGCKYYVELLSDKWHTPGKHPNTNMVLPI